MRSTPILPSKKEQYFSWGYLALQNLILSWVLSLVNWLLPKPLSSAALNFLYFSLNFTAVILGMRDFLLKTVRHALKRLPAILLTATVGFAVYLLSSTALTRLLMLLSPGFSNVNDQSIAALTRDRFLLMALGTVILVPLAEECLHRGGVFGSLLSRSRPAAYALSTLLFSLIHVSGYIGTTDPVTLLLCFVQYFPAGLCLAAAYDLSGSIAAPILIHALVNLTGILCIV